MIHKPMNAPFEIYIHNKDSVNVEIRGSQNTVISSESVNGPGHVDLVAPSEKGTYQIFVNDKLYSDLKVTKTIFVRTSGKAEKTNSVYEQFR